MLSPPLVMDVPWALGGEKGSGFKRMMKNCSQDIKEPFSLVFSRFNPYIPFMGLRTTV
jgi:hypothetical protein